MSTDAAPIVPTEYESGSSGRLSSTGCSLWPRPRLILASDSITAVWVSLVSQSVVNRPEQADASIARRRRSREMRADVTWDKALERLAKSASTEETILS